MSPPHPHRGVVHLQFERHIMEKNEGNVCKFSNSNKKGVTTIRHPLNFDVGDAGANWRVPGISLDIIGGVMLAAKLARVGFGPHSGFYPSH